MSRVLHGIEKGIRLWKENSDTEFLDLLFGTSVPGGDAGEQDAAPIGSAYFKSDGSFYQKIASTNAASDWALNGASSATVGTFRPESLRVVTSDTVTVGTRDLVANPFADDNAPLITAADFSVNDYVIADSDGTPVILQVTAVSAPNVTFAAYTPALSAGNVFFTHNYLPDPAGQEGAALVYYSGSVVNKIADIDWNLATGITLSGTYTAASGNVTAGDTVEVAIQKLDGVNDNQDTLLGTAQGATNLGTFTGETIPDNQTVKQALQSLETAFETNGQVVAAGITAITTVDSVLVDTVAAVKWYVRVSEDANPNRIKGFEVFATHNGHAAADATLVDDTVYANLKLGTNFNLTLAVDISGTGATQALRLRASSSTAGVTVRVFREVVKF